MALLALLAVTSAASSGPGEFETEITLRPAPRTKKAQPLPAARLKSVIEARLGVLGSIKGTVRVDDDGTAHVRVPAGRYTDVQLHWLARQGHFEMVWLPSVQNAQLTEAPLAVTVFLVQGVPTYRFFDNRQQRFVPQEVVLKQASRVAGGQDLETGGASLVGSEDSGLVALKFNPRGARRIAAFARRHPRDTVAFVLDGEIVAGPMSVPPSTERRDVAGRLVKRESAFANGQIQVLPVVAAEVRPSFIPAILNGGELPGPLTIVDQKEVREEPETGTAGK